MMNTCETQIITEYSRTDFLSDPESIELLCFRQNQLRVALESTVNTLIGNNWLPNYMKSNIFRDTRKMYKGVTEKLYYTRELLHHRSEIEADIGADYEVLMQQYKDGYLSDAYHTLTKNNEDKDTSGSLDSLNYDDKINTFNNYLLQRYGIEPIPEDYKLEYDIDTIQDFKEKDRKPPATLYERAIRNIAMIKLYDIFNKNRVRLGQKLTSADIPIYKHLMSFDKGLEGMQLTAPLAPFNHFDYGNYVALESLETDDKKKYIMDRLGEISFQAPELKEAFCAAIQEQLNGEDVSMVDIENELSMLALKVSNVRYDYEKPRGYNRDKAVNYSDGCISICLPNAKNLKSPNALKEQILGVITHVKDMEYEDSTRKNAVGLDGYYNYISNLHEKYDVAQKEQLETVELSDVEKKLEFVQNVLTMGNSFNDMTGALFAAKCGRRSLTSYVYDLNVRGYGFDVDKFIEGANALYNAIANPEIGQEEKESYIIKGADAMISTYASLGTHFLMGQMYLGGYKQVNTFYRIQNTLIKGLSKLGEEFKDSPRVKEYMNTVYGKISFENFGNMYLAQVLDSGIGDPSKVNMFNYISDKEDKEDTKWLFPWRVCLATLLSDRLTPEMITEINNYKSYELQSKVLSYAAEKGITPQTVDVLKSNLESNNREIVFHTSPGFNSFFSVGGDFYDYHKKVKVDNSKAFEQLFNKVEALSEKVAYNIDGNGEPQHVTNFVNGFRQPTDDDLLNNTLRSADSLTDRDE